MARIDNMIDELEHPYLGAEFGRRYVDPSTVTNARQAGEYIASNEAFWQRQDAQEQVARRAATLLEEHIAMKYGGMTDKEKLEWLVGRTDELIKRQVDSAEPDFCMWRDRTVRFLAQHFGEDSRELEVFKRFNFATYRYSTRRRYPEQVSPTDEKNACVGDLKRAKAILVGYLDEMGECGVGNESENQGDGCMHPTVWMLADKAVDAGLYADAVERAFKEINSRVKKLVKGLVPRDADGVGLMQKVFSPEKPLIRLADDLDTSGEDVQRGYMFMFAGGMAAIRNPKAHDNIEISKDDALRKLYFASMLMYKLDEAEQQGWIGARRSSK